MLVIIPYSNVGVGMESLVNRRYKVVRSLGEGGMGTVLLVEDTLQNQQQVALKMMRADQLDERNLAQFKYEFLALAQLRHPHVVQVFDFGYDEALHTYFFAMEYVAGDDWATVARQRAASGTLSFAWLYDVLVQVLGVLQYIHVRGFVHYDIKPLNVNLMPDGAVKLIDFGLIGQPQAGGQIYARGTPEYVAPEVVRGVAVDHRADLYSLGVCLYEIVTGHLFSSAMLATDDLDLVLTGALQMTTFALPDCLVDFMAKLLAREPDARYCSANAALLALNVLLREVDALPSYATVQTYIQGGALIGRRFALARVQGALLRVMQGHGRLLLLAGPAGVGKSRLLRELRLHAQMQRVLVCEAVCDEYVRTPYRPWVSIFKQIFAQSLPEYVEQLHYYYDALVGLMPDLVEVFDADVALTHVPEAKQRMLVAISDGVLMFERPLMLILDDLQYADAETLEFLDVLGQQAHRGKVLLVGLYRDTDIDAAHPLQHVAARARVISRRGPASSNNLVYPHELLRLDLLEEDAVAELVQLMLGIGLTDKEVLPDGLLPWLMTETGGNPLFIESVMRILVEDQVLHYAGDSWRLDMAGIARMPSRIQETAQRRLACLDDAGLRLLQWAAVMGQWLDLALLAEVSGSPSAVVDAAVAMGMRYYVLTLSEHSSELTYRFSNEPMRLAIYNTLSAEERAQAHKACAEMLAQRLTERDRGELLSLHYARAGLLDQALTYASLAGDRARQVYAYQSAVGYYDQALDFADALGPTIVAADMRYTLLLRRAEAYEHLGLHRERAVALVEMAQIARAINDVVRQVNVMIQQVAVWGHLGEHSESIQIGETALALARQLEDVVLIVDSLDVLGEAYFHIGDVEAAYVAHQEALTLCQSLNDRPREAHLLWHLGLLARMRDGMSVAREYMKQSLELQRGLGNQAGVADALNELALQSLDFAQQRYYQEQSLEIARAIGDRNRQSRSFNNLALTYWGLGLYTRAREYIEQAVQMGRDTFSRSRLVTFLESLGRIYFDLEDYLRAQQAYEEGMVLARSMGDIYAESLHLYGMAQVKLAGGALTAARDFFARALDIQEKRHIMVALFSSQAGLALACLELGDWELANTHVLAAIKSLNAIGGRGEFLPQEVWWIRYQVLRAAPEGAGATRSVSDMAWEALQQAHTVMMEGIATLTDEGLRRNYLNKVRVNREIIAEWTRRFAEYRPNDTLEHVMSAVELERDAMTEAEQLRDRLKRVLDISVRMNEIHDADALLNYVMEQVIELSGAERGVLVLFRGDRDLDYRIARGIDVQDLMQGKAEISYSVLGSVSQSRQSVLLQDALTDERFGLQDSVLELNLRSVLCVPLIAHADLIGMIYADNRSVSGRFSQSDLSLMMLFANQAATAIENANLYGKLHTANTELEVWTHTLETRVEERTAEVQAASAVLEQRAVQLETSRQVAQQITSILELDTLLERVVTLIQAQFNYYFVGVWMVDATQTILTLRVGADNQGQRLHLHGFELRLDMPSLNAAVFKAGEARVVQNVTQVEDFMWMQELPYLASEFVMPLRVGEQVLGTLNIGCDQPDGFTDDDAGMLSGLADQIAIAIRNAQLYEVEQRRRKFAELLEQAGRELTRSLDMSEVPGRILSLMRTLVPYERGMVMLQAGDELKPVAHHGFLDLGRAEAMRVPIHEGDVYQQLSHARRPLIIHDVSQDPAWLQVPWLPLNRSWMGVLLMSQGRAMGMISLTRCEAHAFSDEDATWVQAFASQASVALENARYNAEIVRFNEQLEQRVRERTQQLNDANRVLEKLDKNKSDFIDIAAHELFTPVTVIIGFAQIVQRYATQNDGALRLSGQLAGILTEANRMHAIINNMLDVARIGNQTLQMLHEDTILWDLICRVRTGFVEVCEARHLTLTMTDLEDLPMIQADAELLQKAFYHLMVNAIKYTPDGGIIVVRGREVQMPHAVPGIEVMISDAGIGIDQSEQELIFEKFYQTGSMESHSSGETKFKAGGPGLGLAIAKGIVLAHSGQIWVESEGCDEESCPGSQFYVQLPIDKA